MVALAAGLLTTTPAEAVGVTCRGRVATVVGTDGDDLLVGTPGPDVIAGLDGNDRISGRDGNDLVCGGDGSDDITGGPGDDRLFGGLDDRAQRESNGGAIYYVLVGDVVDGGSGDDHIDLGYDEREGREEPDGLRLSGSRGTTIRLPVPGARAVASGHGRDIVLGQPTMSVIGSDGPDRIWGTPGDDDITGAGGNDVIRGLGGDDVILDGAWGSGWTGDDRLLGGRGSDTVTSTNGHDLVWGGSGSDTLHAGRHTTVRGNRGADRLQYFLAGAGCISALGGQGSDVLALRPPDSWADPVQVDLDGGSIGPCGLVDDMETVYLSPGFGASPPPEWQLRGTNHAERVYVLDAGRLVADLRGGRDGVVGGPGDDIVEGGPGRDRIDGYLGIDTCTGFEVVVSCEET